MGVMWFQLRFNPEFNELDLNMEEELLILSGGLKTLDEVLSYKSRLEVIKNNFIHFKGGHSDPFYTGQKLLEFIHKNDKEIYQEDQFSLTTLIDSFLRDEPKGNCLALSSFYAVLGQDFGLKMSVLENSHHVKLKLYDGHSFIIVETTIKKGFGLGELSNKEVDSYFYEKYFSVKSVLKDLRSKRFYNKTGEDKEHIWRMDSWLGSVKDDFPELVYTSEELFKKLGNNFERGEKGFSESHLTRLTDFVYNSSTQHLLTS